MILLKTCPRCRLGDLAFSTDIHGKYVHCLQCGYLVDLETTSATQETATGRRIKQLSLAQADRCPAR